MTRSPRLEPRRKAEDPTVARLRARAEEIGKRKAVEVAVEQFDGSTRTVRGRLVTVGAYGVYVEVVGSLQSFAAEKVRYISPVDELANCASYRDGDRVRVCAYGNPYAGKVVEVKRTRLVVRFQTGRDERVGAYHERSFPAIEVERILRETSY